MKELDLKDFINGISNDLKISIDDLTGAIVSIYEEVEKLKNKDKTEN